MTEFTVQSQDKPISELGHCSGCFKGKLLTVEAHWKDQIFRYCKECAEKRG